MKGGKAVESISDFWSSDGTASDERLTPMIAGSSGTAAAAPGAGDCSMARSFTSLALQVVGRAISRRA